MFTAVSLFLFKTSLWLRTLPGYSDPGCLRGREELVLVVAQDREEREREEKEEKARGAQSGAI